MLLDINPDYGYVIGVDIGETRIRVELFDLAMTERAKAEYPLNPAEHEADVVVRDIAAGLNAVLADGGVDPAAVLGVGIGVPGIVEQGPDVLVHAQTYRWDAVPLERLLRAHTGLPLQFENGAKTMGQAELWFGAGRGVRNAAVVLIGSGVGASLISGGSTYQGPTSTVAEWGHTTIVVGGRRCRCGSAGCLEAYVGAEAILDQCGSPAALSADDEESMLAALIARRFVAYDRRRPGGDRGIPGRRHRQPDQLVPSGAGHSGWLGRPAAWRKAAAGDPRICAAALAATPVRRRVDRARPARTGGGRARRGHATYGGLPQRRYPPTAAVASAAEPG